MLIVEFILIEVIRNISRWNIWHLFILVIITTKMLPLRLLRKYFKVRNYKYGMPVVNGVKLHKVTNKLSCSCLLPWRYVFCMEEAHYLFYFSSKININYTIIRWCIYRIWHKFPCRFTWSEQFAHCYCTLFAKSC